MRKLSKKEIQLAGLLVVLGVVLFVQYRRGAFSTETVFEDDLTRGKTAKREGLPSFTEVSLDKLSPEVAIRRDTRNLFNYSKSPDEAAEEIRQQRHAERMAAEAEKRRQEEAERMALAQAQRAKELAINPPPPPPPVISFKFIGKMGQPKAPIAILADGPSGEILTVREGEVIQEKFKVRKIDFDSITIGYVDPKWGETRTIRMGS